MPRGGKRPGAGRKPGGTSKPGPGRTPKRKVAPGPVRAAEDRIRDRLPELVDEAIRQALEDHSEAQTRYCIDRVLGKPTQPVDLVTRVRDLAVIEGLTEEEAAEAIAEAERLMRSARGTRA